METRRRDLNFRRGGVNIELFPLRAPSISVENQFLHFNRPVSSSPAAVDRLLPLVVVLFISPVPPPLLHLHHYCRFCIHSLDMNFTVLYFSSVFHRDISFDSLYSFFTSFFNYSSLPSFF